MASELQFPKVLNPLTRYLKAVVKSGTRMLKSFAPRNLEGSLILACGVLLLPAALGHPQAISGDIKVSDYEATRVADSEGRAIAGEEDEDSPRKSQIDRRLGLSSRRGKEIDPRVFEARGRELRGEFYEISATGGYQPIWKPHQSQRAVAPTPNRPTESDAPASVPESSNPIQVNYAKPRSGAWILWTGVIGIATGAAATMGYIVLDRQIPPAKGKKTEINIDDKPVQ